MQLSLFDNSDLAINVASVPQRSPFRYPGGKTWLIPYIRQWLNAFPQRPTTLVEPFAGGAIVGLTAAAESLADHVELIELDEDVAAVWQVLLQSTADAEWLAERIMCFELTLTNVTAVLTDIPNTTRERAFRTIIKNRVNRGGILATGAGLIKAGEAGKGLSSRWYPLTLQKRMIEIVKNQHKISFIQDDALQVLAQRTWLPTTAFFIDPPYTASKKGAGSRLYTHNELDHDKLFALVAQLPGQVLMTYDDSEAVRSLAAKYQFIWHPIVMKNTHHARKTELLIGKQLDWLLKS